MTAHRGPVALSVALLLAATAACQYPGPGPRPGPSASDDDGGFTLVASGDVLPHMSVIEQAHADAGGHGHDFVPMLAGVKHVVSAADLAICHMETVYGADGDYSGYPVFRSPPEVAEALAATGYDACSTASNHTLDDGAPGVRRTLDALDRVGVRHAGSARTEEEALQPTLMRVRGARVAHLAYTYGTNGIPLPADRHTGWATRWRGRCATTPAPPTRAATRAPWPASPSPRPPARATAGR
ncbi:putative lipoprotein [Streptomyces scabiei 87.22]|uniref:Putative lipoprotein n=1 Tax=Streptomyces scabiei (strain 87.22) TaxID=680198 RepID=C9Z525_STRSW|nr:putative lipoprotein [Streptomyces scabiei 87.22]